MSILKINLFFTKFFAKNHFFYSWNIIFFGSTNYYCMFCLIFSSNPYTYLCNLYYSFVFHKKEVRFFDFFLLKEVHFSDLGFPGSCPFCCLLILSICSAFKTDNSIIDFNNLIFQKPVKARSRMFISTSETKTERYIPSKCTVLFFQPVKLNECGWQESNLHSEELDPKSSASASSATSA